MIRMDIKRTQFYLELIDKENKEYFSQIRSKFVHNIDTLYFNIFLREDSNENERLISLFNDLDDKKQAIKDSKGKKTQEFRGLDVKLGSHAMVYNYRLQEPDKYDIFLADYLPNKGTPRITIQIRSYGLWCFGVSKMVLESFAKIEEILKSYGMEIERTQENRIDYAFHTNAIQNPYKFFSDKNLDKYLYSTLTKYYKIGNVNKKSITDFLKENKNIRGINKFTLDYFALGQLKSNNIFERNYNKTREVVELGYKSFFFQTWYDKKLINFYDKFCLEFAYKKQNYNAVDEGRLRFYLKFGKDNRIKKEINLELSSPNLCCSDIKKLADIFMPKVTVIMNIEFQTKRKFYYYADKQINLLPVVTKNVVPELNRIFKILDNRSLFLDYLTSKAVAFVEKVEQEIYYIDDRKLVRNIFFYQPWWKRLRSLKINISDKKYKRDYPDNLDLEKMLKKSHNVIATNAVYNKHNNTSFIEDVADLFGFANDNDMRDLALLDKNTGDILYNPFISKEFDKEYLAYKQKKQKAIRNRLCVTTPSLQNPKSNSFNS